MSNKLVKVTWLDAFGEVDKTIYSEHEISHAPIILESVGWLLRENEEGVTIAMDRNPSEVFTYRNVGFIPAQMVKQVEVLYVRKSRQK